MFDSLLTLGKGLLIVLGLLCLLFHCVSRLPIYLIGIELVCYGLVSLVHCFQMNRFLMLFGWVDDVPTS